MTLSKRLERLEKAYPVEQDVAIFICRAARGDAPEPIGYKAMDGTAYYCAAGESISDLRKRLSALPGVQIYRGIYEGGGCSGNK